MKRLFALLLLVFSASNAAAQFTPPGGAGVVAEQWQLTVAYTGANGQTFDAPQNVGIYKIYLGGVIIQQWGATPVVGAPVGGFISTYGGNPVPFTGVVKSFRFKDVKIN